MGFFPTDAVNDQEVGPNANGSYFKYVAVDDKWILIPNADVYTETEVDALLHPEDHDNVHHTTNYEVANANIQTHVTVSHEPANANIQTHVGGTPPTSAHHVKTSTSDIQAVSINNLSEDASPQLGADLDLNGKTINCNGNLGADHTFEGLVIDNLTNAQAFGKLVYIASAHTTALCDKDSIVLAIGISVGTGEVLFSGTIRDDSFSGLAAGNPVYVGDDGNPTDDISAYAVGDMVQCIGVVIDTNVILIKDICWVEIV